MSDFDQAVRELVRSRNGAAATSGLDPKTIAKFKPGGAFLFDEPPEVHSIWGNDDEVLWALSEPLLIVGPSGVGKTTIGNQLVRARMGMTDSVLGFRVEPGRKKVLYLALDRPRQLKRAMVRLFSPADRKLLDDRLVVWEGPLPGDLVRNTELLCLMVEAADADTLVIDSLKDMAIGLSEDSVGSAVNRAIQRVIAEGIQVVALHHQRKGSAGEKPTNLADVYGSTWLTAGAGSVVLLWGAAGDAYVELRHLKQPAATVGPLTVEHDHVSGVSRVTSGFDLARFMRARPQGVTAMEVACAWYGVATPVDNQRKRAERALKAMVNRGVARKLERQRGEGSRFGGTPYVLNEGEDVDEE